MATASPKISVVMTTYNVSSYLTAAISSILRQTERDFEFIIVEGGSSDGTQEIIASYDDPRLRIINWPVQGNFWAWYVPAFNKGIQQAKGKYIARMDADDISAPKRFERQMEIFNKETNLVLIGVGADYITESGAIGKRPHSGKCHKAQKTKTDILLPNFAHGSAMYLRQKAVDVGLYRKEFIKAQDKDLWYRMAEIGDVALLDEPLFLYRLGTSNIGSSLKSAGTFYGELAHYFCRQRLLKGTDELDRGCFCPKSNKNDRKWQIWRSMTRNSLVARIETHYIRSILLSLLAIILAPSKKRSYRALYESIFGAR